MESFLSYLVILSAVIASQAFNMSIHANDELPAFVQRKFDHTQRRLTENYWASLQQYTSPSRMLEIAKAQKEEYQKRKPFPHYYIDNLFPEDVLLAAEKEVVDNPARERGSKGCVKGNSVCFSKADEKYKNAFDSDLSMGPATATLFAYMKSSAFLKFLEELTGIKDIIADPHYRGSGIHQTMKDGYLRIHADFNRYKQYDLHRRVNCFIFLNPNWNDSYGGHLELWSKDMKQCNARLAPILGRFAVFSSTDFSYHGHPEPLKCPSNRSRRSLALYYYTRTRPKSECLNQECDGHGTLFQESKCGSCSSKKCQNFVNTYQTYK